MREPKQFWGVSDLIALKEPLREPEPGDIVAFANPGAIRNPIAVLENVTEAQDIAVQPGAVWGIPEKARAYCSTYYRAAAQGCTSSSRTCCARFTT